MFAYIVESYRWDLHESKREHSVPNFQTNPPLWAWILSAESKDKEAAGRSGERKEECRQSILSLGYSMSLVVCFLHQASIGEHVGVEISNNGSNERADVDETCIGAPEVRRLSNYL